MDNQLLYNKAFAKIKQAKNIFLATHERPDVDAVASVCAFIEFLENLNIPYFAYAPNKPPFQFSFIPHMEKINYEKESFNLDNYDLIIVLDCGNLKRTKLHEEIKNRNADQYLIEIDHHIKTEDGADLEIREPNLSSTTELVHKFFKANKIKINKNIATCILSGILTDSGNFIYQSTSDKTIEISGEMLKYGANLPQIIENTWRNKSLSALKIWGTALSRLELNKKYGIAFSVLTLEDIEGVDEEDLEGISNFLGNLEGAKAVMLLREQKDGTIRGSLRSAHPTVDVSVLARRLGGGGHAKASGFTIEGKLEKTESGWIIV